MRAIYPGLVALAVLAGCDGNPVASTTSTTGSGTTGSGTTAAHSVALLPGTTDPSPTSDITRTEAQVTDSTAADYGNGYATGFSYNKTNDTFSVDNLAFDGNNVYKRDTALAGGSLNGFAVYDGPTTAKDVATGATIPQYLYRALYGVSKTGKTNFAIVRTGQYVPYGFGGFIYQRKGGVTMPASAPPGAQAKFTGSYAGLRDYNGAAGLQYDQGDMTVSIDLNDFNGSHGVDGVVSNRRIYDVNGNDVTSTVLAGVNATVKPLTPMTQLPDLVFSVGPGAMDANGEMAGTLGNSYVDSAGSAQTFESGQYYAVVAGNVSTGNGEITGIIVVTSPNYATGVTARETGGFFLYQ